MDNIRKTIRQLLITMSKLDKTYTAWSGKLGSQSSELWLMYALDDGQPHSQKQICDEWGFPKTTINSIIKKCETAGYLTLLAIPGKRREMQICLTEKGKAYAKQLLNFVYQAENKAMEETLKIYPAEFFDAIKLFNKCLEAEFDGKFGTGEESII
ncbi:MAG: winged helix-turn-helix transcriptional regulator [Lachnospiraceae bacterium]|nr:winged helix-turn-helix transcriptional regulator [Lachnospiraceae bacterium]